MRTLEVVVWAASIFGAVYAIMTIRRRRRERDDEWTRYTRKRFANADPDDPWSC